jgi:hypothetical protein
MTIGNLSCAKVTEMKFYTWCNVVDFKRKKWTFDLLNDSAKIHGIRIEPIGTGRDLHEGGKFNGKNLWLYEEVCKLNKKEIVVCMDAFDVVCFADETEILNKFKKLNKPIVWSSEFTYCHQMPKYKNFYTEVGGDNLFKYLNAGFVIGYAENIKEMYETMSSYTFSRPRRFTYDQAGVGRYIAENPSKAYLDYICEIVWTDQMFEYSFLPKSSEDASDRLEFNHFKDNRVFNTITKSYPCFLHVAGGKYNKPILKRLKKLLKI